jgi:hypothetical protein
MRIGLIGGSIAIALAAALSSSATPSRAYIPQPWCTELTRSPSGCASLHVPFVCSVRGKCACRLRRQPGDRSAPDGSRFHYLHVSPPCAPQLAACLTLYARQRDALDARGDDGDRMLLLDHQRAGLAGRRSTCALAGARMATAWRFASVMLPSV